MSRRTPREVARRLAFNTLVVGTAWAAAQPLLCIVPPGLLLAWVGNGMMFGAYAAVLFAMRGGSANMTRAVVLGFLGASHCVWVLPIGHVANNALQAFSPVPDVGMWVGTAVILGTGVAIATLRWWAALLPTVCLGMAVLLIRLWPSGLTNLLTFGLMTGAIHAGLLATLAVDTHEFLKRRWPQWACAHCGYDLRDLVAPACPECGQPRGRLPTQA